MKQKLVLLENEDKKQDQQRYLVWFSALSVTIFIVVLMTPLIPIERINHLSGIAEIWVLSNMGVIGSFIGFNQIAKKKETK
jgi:nicotinamide riboside transporter PnuC